MKIPPYPALARTALTTLEITYKFEGGNIVTTDAAELVKVDYKVLKAVVNTGDAMNSESIHDGIDKNLSFDWELGDKETDEAFASADKIVKMTLTNNRLAPNAMEPRASIGDFNPSSEELTLYTTSQNPHLSRLVMSAFNAIHPNINLDHCTRCGMRIWF